MRWIFYKLRRYCFVVILYGIFLIGCLSAPVIVMFYVPLKKIEYIRGVVLAADRMMAAQLGFSGKFTVSTECAHDDRYK